MDALLKMLAGKKQSKASLQVNRYSSFRKVPESSYGPKQDNNSTEARRKAAVWAWYQRGGETVFSTRKMLERNAVAPRDCIVDRPKSRFKAEATRESSSYDSLSKSTRDCETNLFDASELSSTAEGVQLLVQELKVEVPSENPSLHRAGNADITLNEGAIPSSTSDRSKPPIAQSHRQTFEKENTFDHQRSFSDLSGPRQFHQQTSGKIETHSSGVHLRSRAETDCLRAVCDVAESIPSKPKKSAFRRPFSVVQRLFPGTSRGCSNPCSEVNTQAQTHHHYHHHHHFYYHQISHAELQPPEITSKARPPRRNSESFTVYTEEGAPSHETRRVRRHSVDCTGDAATEVRDYFYRRPAADEGLVQSKVHPSMQRGIQRALPRVE